MASFSIDEVRESFHADMTQRLAEIAAAAGALESSLAALPSLPRDANARPLFEAIADRAHAVTGTGSLVGASSLAESARRLEALGRDGQIALNRAREQLARAVQIAQLCGKGAEAMEGMLALELDHRRAEADGAAERWLQLANVAPIAELHTEDLEMLAEVEAGALGVGGTDAPAPPAEEFSFEDDSVAPPPPAAEGREFSFEGEPPAPSGAMDELKGIFQRELRDALPTLQGQLDALRTHPEDLVAAEQIERIYHTLKGASATVGLTKVSQLAASLQERLEQSIESGTGLAPGLLDDLVQDTDRVLELTGLAPLAAAPPLPVEASPSPSGGADSAGELFLHEARAILEEASRLAAELPAAAAEDASRIRETLGGLFHRLKGSSLVAGNVAAADAAAELQARCEGGAAIDAAALATGLRRLGAMIGSPGGIPSGSRSHPVSRRERIEVEREPELWDAFHQECTELLEGIEKEVLALEDAEQPRRLLQSLMRQHHTLKGAANSVGLAPTGRLLHRVEDFLESLLEAPLLPPMKEVANLLLEVQVEVRKHLATAPQGFVENSLDHVDTRIRQVVSGARVGASPSSSAADESRHSARTESTGSNVAAVTAAEKRFIRVAA